MSFLLSVFYSGLWKTEGLISIQGDLGKTVRIKCSHSNAFFNVKYFCRGQCGYEDILISSTEKKDSNHKYNILDEGNTFYVTISSLTVQDAGTFWCGIERIGLDTYNEVVLTVTEGKLNTFYSLFSFCLHYATVSVLKASHIRSRC